MPTRTGSFPIGLRRTGSDWMKDLTVLAGWAKSCGFESMDLGQPTAADVNTLQSAGLRLGSADLLTGKFQSKDSSERKEGIVEASAYIQASATVGTRIFFTIVSGDPAKKPSENYAIAVDTFGHLAQAAEKVGAVLAIEGWPGMPPHYAQLCCTPETLRPFIRDTNPKVVGLNYDPSHLIRLGIDHIRFLNEFLPYVHHVHGKDTQILRDTLYEFGLYQTAAFSKAHRYGEHVWRYTIPGHGQARWTDIMRILQSGGYKGMVSVELEDENFNGTEQGEKAGYLAALALLQSA